MARWQAVPYFFFPCGEGGRFVEAMEEIVATAGVFVFSCLGFLSSRLLLFWLLAISCS